MPTCVTRLRWVAAAVSTVLALAACGGASSSSSTTTHLVVNTAPGSKPVAAVTWGLYRDVDSIDPIMGFDYPENTVDSVLCDALFRQSPSGVREPGLALSATYPAPTTLVLDLRPGVTFWDGTPMTSADVVYSLQRAASVKAGGFYTAVFSRVKSIDATGPLQVTIKLTQPDFWLEGELSSLPGMIIEKAYAEKQGTKYGTISGGGMCTGPYKVSSWTNNGGLVAAVNPAYWDKRVHAKVKQYTFKGFTDTAMTSGLLTGSIGITFSTDPTILARLQTSNALRVSQGDSYITDALVISNLKGVLSDVRVRQALQMALDTRAYARAAYQGLALPPRALANPGTWGYAPGVFEAGWNALPPASQNVATARKLVTQAGATGKTLTIGMSNEISQIQDAAATVQQAAQAIGLKVVLRAFPAATYIDLFTNAKYRSGLDGFFTRSYPDYAAPEAQYEQFVLADGSLNYSGWSDPQVTALFNQSRGTADPTARAQLIVQAQKIIQQQLPWIGLALPYTVLVTQKNLTGAPASFSYMYAPWAAVGLGGT